MNNLLYLVWLIAFIWSLYDIWTGKKDQGKKILWTIVCLVLPVLGTIIYLVAGRK
jgi:hypothetical protein